MFNGFIMATAENNKTKSKYEPLATEVPIRPSNQKDVLALTTSKIETVRVGFIGLGMWVAWGSYAYVLHSHY